MDQTFKPYCEKCGIGLRLELFLWNSNFITDYTVNNESVTLSHLRATNISHETVQSWCKTVIFKQNGKLHLPEEAIITTEHN